MPHAAWVQMCPLTVMIDRRWKLCSKLVNNVPERLVYLQIHFGQSEWPRTSMRVCVCVCRASYCWLIFGWHLYYKCVLCVCCLCLHLTFGPDPTRFSQGLIGLKTPCETLPFVRAALRAYRMHTHTRSNPPTHIHTHIHARTYTLDGNRCDRPSTKLCVRAIDRLFPVSLTDPAPERSVQPPSYRTISKVTSAARSKLT